MKIPTIEGVIERRILVNYTVDKDVLAKFLPKPFRPKLVEGKGLAGICLIRLKNIRPQGFPKIIGIGSENAAHRVAVEWTENGETRSGVFIPRRDTNCLLNHWTGGHLFPGVHHMAKFEVDEQNDNYKIAISNEKEKLIAVSAKRVSTFDPKSIFKDLETASEFFKSGAIGFSPNKKDYDGLELKTLEWHVEPMQVESVSSSFFENEPVFPKGSVTFDNALLMRNLKHKWDSYDNCPCP